MPTKDINISTEVKATLPKELTAKLHEIERVLGKAVVFLEVPAIGGSAAGGVSSNGTIWLPASSKTNLLPFLEGIGLNPRAVVDAVVPNTARDLKNAIRDVKADGDTDYWRVTLSALFSQAKIITSGKAGEQALAVFDDASLQSYAKTGRLVCDEIVAAQNEDAKAVKARMERTLFTHLALKADTVEVRPEY